MENFTNTKLEAIDAILEREEEVMTWLAKDKGLTSVTDELGQCAKALVFVETATSTSEIIDAMENCLPLVHW